MTPPVALGDALLKILETIWRTLLIIFLGVVGVVVIVAVAAWAQSLRIGEPQLSELQLTIRPYDMKLCDAEFPLFIGIVNKSRRTVKRTYLALEARRPDRSTNLVSYSGQSLDNDAIIKPGEGWGNCWSVPELTGLDQTESARTLVWSVRATTAEWAE
ncbi:MAG: hypothetical protein WCY15_05350 [Phenylobacterium sp.]|uniref:hypothetical protein n=1 Tax=Phenylobacterium sp. TaxID=1871053 RepID=UPI002A257230|nr:hypothetical protein [Phenylobacterium sp.]MDD3836970.1 hypothetical protein [Phenylobacterium sp.]MDX9997206.1 hypothetical protein [Phenylobacterium sp.]